MSAKKGYSQAADGEPFVVEMTKHKLEKSRTGGFWQECCQCGLRHLFTIEEDGPRLKVRAYQAP